jgi:DNA transposition AAA+ family ATPase
MKTTPQLTGKSAAAGDSEQAERDVKFTSHDPELHRQLFELQRRKEWSDETLGRKLGKNGSYVSRYRHNSPEKPFIGSMPTFEACILQLLTTEDLMEGDRLKLSDKGFAIDGVWGFLRYIHANRMIGVGFGEAGRGKTCAARLFAARNPNVVYVHVYKWSGAYDPFLEMLRSAGRVRIGLAASAKVGTKTRKKETVAEALVRTFRDSDRLIIIDNAQRLTEASRKFLADFYDVTRTPIAMLGNPEIEDQWNKNDQHGSRLGRAIDVTLNEPESAPAANKSTVHELLSQFMPSATQDVAAQKLTLEVIKTRKRGACRTARYMLTAAEYIAKNSAAPMSAAEAIRLAQTQLVGTKEAA